MPVRLNPFTGKLTPVFQSPWLSDIDGNNFSLDFVKTLSITTSDVAGNTPFSLNDNRTQISETNPVSFSVSGVPECLSGVDEYDVMNISAIPIFDPLYGSQSFGMVGTAGMLTGYTSFMAGLNFNVATAPLFVGGSATCDTAHGISIAIVTFGGDMTDTVMFAGQILAFSGGTRANGSVMEAAFIDTTNPPWGIVLNGAWPNNLGPVRIGPSYSKSALPVSASLDLTHTDKTAILNRLTTTQRDALTAVDGMILYNTTTSKLQGRAGGAWVDLH